MEMGPVNYVALAVLILMGLYVLSLIYNNFRAAGVVERGVSEEIGLLKERVERIKAVREFDKQKNELSWNGVRKFRVARKNPENSEICSFYLQPHDERPLPPFEPGQYLTFKLDLPSGKKVTTRCYSLSDSPQSEYYRVSIKRNPPPKDPAKSDVGKSSSNFFHDHVEEGDILNVQAPGGDFFLDMHRQTPVVLIGGGIGITPVLSMLNAIVESGSKRETWFFLGIRNSAEHVFREHLEAIDQANENVHVRIVYSKPDEGTVQGKDYHHEGRVGAPLFQEALPSNNYDYYFCGPPPMMESLFHGLRDWDVPESRIHFEAFGPATVKSKKSADAPAGDAAPAAGAGFKLKFVKSEKEIVWDGSADSILEFAEANDIDMDSGCRAGACGTCITAVLAGDVNYNTDPSADVDKGSCLTCISTPKSDMELDA
jgi:ferredoxin-NADP reductase